MWRRRDALETATVCLAATVAGVTVMVPIDPVVAGAEFSSAWVDLAVFNVPRATTAAAFVTVLAAAFAVMMSAAFAWTTVTVFAMLLLTDQLLWNSHLGSAAGLTYIDSLLAGTIMGIVGTLAWSRRATASGFLFGALTGILIGDFTPAPQPGVPVSFVDRFLLDSPALPLGVLLVAAAMACALANWYRSAPVRRLADVIPLRSIVSAGIIFPTILLTSEWFARDGNDLLVQIVGVVLIVGASLLAALALPGRDGMLLLLMVAFAAAGSTPTTLPRPDWASALFVVAIAAGLYTGYRRGLPLLAAAATAGLAVLSIVTALTGAHGTPLAVSSGLAVAFVGGYCLGAAAPLFPTVPALCLAVLFVPSAAVALWGRDFERVAYSPAWYRATEPARALAPGLVALAITAGCAAAIALLYRLRPTSREAVRTRWAHLRTAAESIATPTALIRPARPLRPRRDALG
ncbi:hypothetical protein [Nocardia sp. NPDC048505]|uniref:hypothetical protein n=1 Tax=unclassified Nocardia TaxID=2637762 RepID=UPI0033E11E69